jgi:uncharacterized protein YcnI
MTFMLMKQSCIAVVLAAVSIPAVAHVVLETREAPAGSYYKATFMVGHGCGSSATTSVRVRIPDGVVSVRPQPKPGWKITLVKEKLNPPLDNGHGGLITETVREVTWTGGPLPDEYFDTFVMNTRLPEQSQVLYFPVVQQCQKGVNRWIETPSAGKSLHDLKQPAAELKLLPKAR